MADILEQETLKELKEAFEEQDRTSEGSISMATATAILRKVGHQVGEADLRKLLIKLGMDPDSKPKLTFATVCSVLVLKMRGADVDEDAEIREAFYVLSRGSDGSHVTHQELKRTMQLLEEQVTDTDVDDMLRFADNDRDGVVNWEDFKRMMTFEENGEKDLSFIRLLSASSAKSRASKATSAATGAAGNRQQKPGAGVAKLS